MMTMISQPSSDFECDTSVKQFCIPKDTYFALHPNAQFNFIATSALVLDTESSSDPRILLVQRAASDSNPNKWEAPGGACDDDDSTILHGAARELWEETGLEATRMDALVGEPHLFTSRSGKRICQFNFAVQVKVVDGKPPAVELDPEEHQDFVWATQQEVKARRAGDVDLDFTSKEVEQIVLLAFEHFRGK